MKVYLVGGAVRDQLLGLPVKEQDWVVVGATPEHMLDLHYKKVGKDFPVFLHPKTQEEYALARTERKSAPGYYGFQCDFSPNIKLEDDLARRDLTINAMAQDEDGQIIDPYNGQDDLKNKVLRHVSPAFVEDPVRVLRVARFAARFHYLGFKLADETRQLMYRMVKQGELNHLVAERVWQEWQKSLEEKNPEQFIWVLRSCDALKIILPEIDRLFGIPNPKKYHPEVDSGIHTLMALEAATCMSHDPVVRFAALIHDLGKTTSPMGQWPKHIAHEERGVKIIDVLCDRLNVPNEYRHLGRLASKFHLNIHRGFELRAKTHVNILEQTDAFRRPQVFAQLLQVCHADAEKDYPQKKLWEDILQQCRAIDAKPIVAEGFSGQAIKEELHKRRVVCVEQYLKDRKLNEK